MEKTAVRDGEHEAGMSENDAKAVGMEETTALLQTQSESHARPHREGTDAVAQRNTPGSRAWRLARLAEGVLYLIIVAAIWVAASVLVQYIYADLHINVPFFLTYVCNSEFIILLPLRYVRERYLSNGVRVMGRQVMPAAHATDWKAAAKAGAIVCPLWFLAQGSYNWSLAGTSVSSSTVLSTTSCVFTFLLSLVILREGFTWAKLAGVAVNIAGAALVSYSDNAGDNMAGNTWWGDALAIFSACMYAVYTTAIRKLVPDDGTVSMEAFFGWLGLFNSIMLFPLVIGLHFGGVEDLRQVTGWFIMWILIKGLFDDVLSDLLWARAILLTSPTLATVALSLTIPMAMLSDLMIHHLVPGGMLAGGSVLVALGFVISTVALNAASPPSTKAAEEPGAAADQSNERSNPDAVALAPAAALTISSSSDDIAP